MCSLVSQTNGRDPSSVIFNSHTVLCGVQGRIDHLDPTQEEVEAETSAVKGTQGRLQEVT